MLQTDRERIANIANNVAASDPSLQSALLGEAIPKARHGPSGRYGKGIACGSLMLYNTYQMARHAL